MKYIILSLLMTLLASCGAGLIDQPITTPTVVNGHSKTVRYSPMIGTPSYCAATIYVNGSALSAGSYSVDCEYDENGRITAFLITYYISLPSFASLQYSLY